MASVQAKRDLIVALLKDFAATVKRAASFSFQDILGRTDRAHTEAPQVQKMKLFSTSIEHVYSR